MDHPCVFCDRSKIAERLIAETDMFYYIATLGQIPDWGGYILIVPKRHVSCVGAMEEREVVELWRAMRGVARAIESEYHIKPVVFEYGIVGQTIRHAHLHLMPADINFEPRVLDDFPEANVDIIVSLDALRSIYSATGSKYLFWSVPARPWLINGGEPIFQVVWDPPAPPQYLRIVAAELLGRPERADWRNINPDDDKKLWSETVARLKHRF